MHTIALNLFDCDGFEYPRLQNGFIAEYDERFNRWYSVFDQAEVMMRLLEAFPDIIIGTHDALLENAQAIESFLKGHGAADDNTVITSEYRRARNIGPVHPFSLRSAANKSIRGYIRRFDVKFCCDDDFSSRQRDRITEFLQGFGAGEIEDYAG